MNDAKRRFDKVIKAKVSQTDQTSYTLFVSSEGVMTHDYRPMVTFGIVSIMQRGEQIENAYAARAFRKGFEFLNEELADKRDEYNRLMADPAELDRILKAGAEKARAVATPFMADIRHKVGIGPLSGK